MANKNLFYTVEWSINKDKGADFRRLADECINKVRDNEPETRMYEWFMNDDNTKCWLNELHTSSESMLAHMGNIQQLLGQLLEVSTISAFNVYGNPSDQASATLKEVGKNIGLDIRFASHFGGFTR